MFNWWSSCCCPSILDGNFNSVLQTIIYTETLKSCVFIVNSGLINNVGLLILLLSFQIWWQFQHQRFQNHQLWQTLHHCQQQSLQSWTWLKFWWAAQLYFGFFFSFCCRVFFPLDSNISLAQRICIDCHSNKLLFLLASVTLLLIWDFMIESWYLK